jgi:hypothetical protein
VKLPKLYKKTCPDLGNLNIFFDGIMKIECKNFYFMIVRRGTNVALDKKGCGIPQELEIIFRKFDIYQGCGSKIIASYKGLASFNYRT